MPRLIALAKVVIANYYDTRSSKGAGSVVEVMLTTSGIDVVGASDEDTFACKGSKVGDEAASHIATGVDGVGATLGEWCMTSLE